MKMDKKIVLVKLYNGDFIIGKDATEISCDKPSVFVLEEPRSIMMAPTMTGEIRMIISSVCEPFKSQRFSNSISIQWNQIFFILTEDEIGKELIDGYKSEISGIEIATPSETASINAFNGNFDFTI